MLSVLYFSDQLAQYYYDKKLIRYEDSAAYHESRKRTYSSSAMAIDLVYLTGKMGYEGPGGFVGERSVVDD